MRAASSSILAICIAASNALPAATPERRSLGVDAPDVLPAIDPSIPGCANSVFIDIWPPSEAELRCRGIDFKDGKIKPHVATEKRQPWTFGGRLPPIDESIPGCKDVAFIDIYPPSEAELKCRGIDTGDKKQPPTKKAKPEPWQVGDQLPPIDESIPGCKDVAFIDIYPPSAAELRCRGFKLDDATKLHDAINKREAREVPRGGLSIKDRYWGRFDESIPGCKGKSFLAVIPPSQAELRCRRKVGEDGKPILPKA